MSWLDDLGNQVNQQVGRIGQIGYNNRVDFGPGDTAGNSTINLKVDPANVLQARKVLLDEADRLRRLLNHVRSRLQLHPMGGDPASIDYARVVTDKLLDNPDSYFNRCSQYVENLRAGAVALAETARQYGYTEDEITDSLRAAGNTLPGDTDA
ncbi:hypothetical protein [Actinoalloteichus hymeniacidonis]|uniref:Uncharacterized protein n=1 Tax=Actinoalloteichus hymeniacidonis TaxID=340345 RepID=A0AAC9HLZ9_9PSEU|nr:hypothetical protein [Actinoalloteichus hymeniacidonis]AOS61744.1 hypothetical protein TL08_04570 [Actinoalloteichus hymeniacidonis]MBB5910238.1 hypothetical protein [Actinoalloteichus hymeniacidonis]